MREKIIEIYWCDLTRKAQESIADLIGININEVVNETNWEAIPMATIPYSPVE